VVPEAEPADSAAMLRKLLEQGLVPTLGASARIFPGENPTKAVIVQNLSTTIAALDVKVSFVRGNDPTGRTVGDVAAGNEKPVGLVHESENWPHSFQLLFSVPSGYRLSWTVVADGTEYKRSLLRLHDRAGIQTA
jgi:hypothetical protein